jgi:hypothetical protein
MEEGGAPGMNAVRTQHRTVARKEKRLVPFWWEIQIELLFWFMIKRGLYGSRADDPSRETGMPWIVILDRVEGSFLVHSPGGFRRNALKFAIIHELSRLENRVLAVGMSGNEVKPSASDLMARLTVT